MRVPVCLALFALALSGCAEFPELEAADSSFVRDADYPKLVPMEHLGISPEEDAPADEASQLGGRANALRNRARRLQGDVIDEAERARLERGVVEG